MYTKILKGHHAKNGIIKGVNILANIVGTTLGPKGKNVIINNNGELHTTKDGVTIANSIHLQKPLHDTGAALLRQVASRTVLDVGDGTTTTCILASNILENYNSLKNKDFNLIKKGIDIAIEEVKNYLLENNSTINSKDCNYIEEIATISSNNDKEIGKILADIFKIIGLQGIVRVEPSDFKDIVIDVSKGMQLNGGFISPVFITDNIKKIVEYDNPLIFISDKKICAISEINNILQIAKQKNLPIVIIAEDFDSKVISTLSLNNAKGIISVCPVKISGYRENKKDLIKDLDILTSSEETVILGTYSVFLNKASKIIIDSNTMTVIDGHGIEENINNKVKELQNSLKYATDSMSKDSLNKRIANLTGGIATIYVGAPTNIEMLELKDRLDDAICAVKTAIVGGISLGGGISYLNAANHLENIIENYNDESVLLGMNIILKSLYVPFLQNIKNANYSMTEEEFILFLKEKYSSEGINTNTNTREDMYVAGIIDPTIALITALENAASISVLILNTDSTLVLE